VEDGNDLKGETYIESVLFIGTILVSTDYLKRILVEGSEIILQELVEDSGFTRASVN
jgi:hypothetical protein